MIRGNSVVIVGAGPVGLITALELVRRNVGVRLIEKRSGPSRLTRAFTLHARTMEMFEHIGVAHRIEEVALRCPGNVFHFPGLTEEDKPRTDFRDLPTRYPFYYKVNQNQFEQVLREHLRAGYGVVPEYDREFVGLVQDESGVEVSIRHGDTGKCETFRCGWVVGCDGARSQVRRQLGVGFTGEQTGCMAMMDTEIVSSEYDGTWVNYFIGEAQFLLATRLPGGLWRLYLSDAEAMSQAEDARASFQAVADQLDAKLTIGQPAWVSRWELFNSRADRYRDRRVFLCGDASHVHTPAGGQGMNGSMQDAFNLGWKLAAVLKGHASDHLLDTYESERLPIGAQITAGAKAMHSVLMGFGQEMDRRIDVTRQEGWHGDMVRLISGLSHSYHGVVAQPAAGSVAGPRAGDRAPDAQLTAEPGKRLFDVLRHGGFTMLLIPNVDRPGDLASAQDIAEAVRANYGELVRTVLVSDVKHPFFDEDHTVVDQFGELAQAYEISPGEARAILVRPDLFVSGHCRLDEAAALVDHLSLSLAARSVQQV